MNTRRFIVAIALFVLAGFSVAQSQEPKEPLPPSGGAIKGGSIAPGETAGVPDEGKAMSTPSQRAVARCKDLEGTLREQCLKDAAGASTGGTRPSDSALPDAIERDPRAAPPPQNPR